MVEKKNAVAKTEKNITDVVLNKVAGFAQVGELVLPQDYSAENALKAAWLALQTVEDKRGNKALKICSQPSIANALLDMVVQGLNPAKKQCYFIVYGKELTLQRSYMGTVAVAKRFSGVREVHAQVVYEGDEFEYEIDPMTANIRITKHTQNLNNIDISKIKAIYAVVIKEDGSPYVEIMTMDQVKKAWNQGATKGDSPAHKNFTEEMAKKTVINRACKLFVNTTTDSALLVDTFNRVTSNDYRKDEQEVIDVEENELKNVAEAAIFGGVSDVDEENENPEEVSGAKESIEEDEKVAQKETDSLSEGTDSEQMKMGDVADE